jgi:hypothetical protein
MAGWLKTVLLQLSMQGGGVCYLARMSDLFDVEKRVSDLAAVVEGLQRASTGNVTAFMRMKAQVSAVYSLLFEVTEQHGFPPDVLETHFQLRTNYYLDRMLADAEDASPSIGATLDDREVTEVPVFDGFPPLFPRERGLSGDSF